MRHINAVAIYLFNNVIVNQTPLSCSVNAVLIQVGFTLKHAVLETFDSREFKNYRMFSFLLDFWGSWRDRLHHSGVPCVMGLCPVSPPSSSLPAPLQPVKYISLESTLPFSTHPLARLILWHDWNSHCFAGEAQVYISVPRVSQELHPVSSVG